MRRDQQYVAFEDETTSTSNGAHETPRIGDLQGSLITRKDPLDTSSQLLAQRLLSPRSDLSELPSDFGDSLRTVSGVGGNKSHGIVGYRRAYFVLMYCATTALLYADQNLMAPNLSQIAADFGFNELQMDRYLAAYISGAFFAVGAPAALVVGYLSDRVDRKWLLFFLVLLGEGPCLATFWVTAYWQLLLLRIMTGISLGGSLPLAYAMVGDLFPVSDRATVSSLLQLSAGAGIAIGQAIAGFTGPEDKMGWRFPFLVVAAPALFVATVLALTTVDPPRGACESVLAESVEEGFVYSEQMDLHKLKRLLKTRSNIYVIMQGLFGCLPWGVILTYMNDYLAAPAGKNYGVELATEVMLANGLGGALGVIGGGSLGQYLYNRRKPLMPLMAGGAVILATIPMYLLLNLTLHGPLLVIAFLCSFWSGCFAGVPGPNVRAVILNVNEPEARGMALALQTVLDDLGKGLGPFLVGMLVQVMGRTAAFNIAVIGWLPCGLLLAAAAWSIEGDEDSMQQRLQDVALRQSEMVFMGPRQRAGESHINVYWSTADNRDHPIVP